MREWSLEDIDREMGTIRDLEGVTISRFNDFTSGKDVWIFAVNIVARSSPFENTFQIPRKKTDNIVFEIPALIRWLCERYADD